jgi:hypothetical protein
MFYGGIPFPNGGGFTSECAIYFCKSLSAKVMFRVSLSLSSPGVAS